MARCPFMLILSVRCKTDASSECTKTRGLRRHRLACASGSIDDSLNVLTGSATPECGRYLREVTCDRNLRYFGLRAFGFLLADVDRTRGLGLS